VKRAFIDSAFQSIRVVSNMPTEENVQYLKKYFFHLKNIL
jgi:hypothetical protein